MPFVDVRTRLWWAPFAVLLGLWIVLLRTAWLSDDAYITLRTVDNWVHGHGLRWNPTERVQAYTHPLWMLVLSAAYFVTREAFVTTIVAGLAITMSAVGVLVAWGRGHPAVTTTALFAVIGSRAFVDYSTSGLENPLSHLLLVLFGVRWLGDADGAVRGARTTGLLGALLALTRLDLVLLVAPSLGWQLVRNPAARRPSAVLALVGLPLAWEVFSVAYYGFPFPNTAYAKLGAGLDRVECWGQGVAYLAESLRNDPITLLTTGVGVALGATSRDPRRLTLAAGVLAYLAYVVHIGGDFMSGRFFSAPLALALVLIVDAGRRSLEAPRAWLPVAVVLLGVVGRAPTWSTGRDHGIDRAGIFDRYGVSDERRFYFPGTGLINLVPLQAKPLSEWSDLGRQARRASEPLLVSGAVGILGFLAGPRTTVIDFNALGDPLLARLPMVQDDPSFAQLCANFDLDCPRSWRIGHFARNIPEGYVDSVLSGENQVEDPRLREYYEVLRTVTRGPLWSWERLDAIVALNTGRLTSLLPTGHPPVGRLRYAPILARFPDTASLTVLREAGAELERQGDLDGALRCYQRWVELDPDDPVGRARLDALAVKLR